MRDQQPVTETMKISEVKQQLNRLVNRVYRHETRVMVEKSGIPVAGIVSAEDLRGWIGSTASAPTLQDSRGVR